MSSTLAAIFDMDGVLVDSYQAHFRTWQRLAQEHGFEYSEAMFARGFGRTGREAVAADWPQRDLSPQQIDEIVRRKEQYYRELIGSDFPAMDGAAELIRELKNAGFRVAVGSSGPRENVELAVERLSLSPLLDAQVTGDDVTRGKPDPQIFLLAAERMEVRPSQCVVIEDAPVGVEAAHAAGMKCAGLASTGHQPEDLREAEMVVPTLRDLSPSQLRALIQPRDPNR